MLRTILLSFFVLAVQVLLGQEKSRLVSGDFSGLTMQEFVRRLETQTPYHFYYTSSQFDSIRINLSVQAQPLDKVLAAALPADSAFQVAIDETDNVFITKGFSIQTSLPTDFLGTRKEAGQATDTVAAASYLAGKKKGQLDASPENKLHEIGLKTNVVGKGNAALSGYVINAKTGEPIINAAIFIPSLKLSAVTDQYGFYSLTIPKGRQTINVQGLGMKDARYQVMMYADGKLNMELSEQVISLKEVVVSAQKLVNINRVQLGVEKLTIQAIRQVPVVFGEADILRAVLTLPGVKTVGEASTGFNVRGGSADQNLILFNDMTIYNPSHFFGLFSAFNPDVVKDIELYKSSIPAKYGSRLSSVLDITGKEGNKKEYHGSAGLGPLTSRINLEGPLDKNKTSFVLGARTTYANWLLNLLPQSYKNSSASFFDANLGISHQLNDKNNLYFTGYLSNDRFHLNSDTAYHYSNANASLKWKHTFNSKLNSVFTTGADRYKYDISSDQNPVNAYKLSFDINQLNFKTDFNYFISSKHTLDFGASWIRYTLHPGYYEPLGSKSLVKPDKMPTEQARESAAYLAERFTITPQLSLNAGIRYSFFQSLGPQQVNQYATGLPRDESSLLNTKSYSKGKVVQTYHGPEYRLAVRYALTNSFSLKAGYNSSRQYIHMLSNTTAIAPTDVWKLSDPNIQPQRGEQLSFGIFKNLQSNTIETSLEVYYKKLYNYLDYKPGAVLVLNHHIETDVVNTGGKAYGLELLVKKQTGKLNGWISYTYSRILLRADDALATNLINKGEFYPANYDKPHDFTFIGNFRVNHRFSVSFNTTYSTGRPITLPVARYYYAGGQRVLYSDRNAYRVPDFFRMDFSMNIEGNHKVHQLTHNSWTIGLYNLTGRKNAYSVYFITENGRINGYKLSIFGSVIPFVNFNIRF
ncbi:MAG: TonB-dependent receptor [Williamsia sp.]|nr:TonB-dependent receptor [Williamsia sp.]